MCIWILACAVSTWFCLLPLAVSLLPLHWVYARHARILINGATADWAFPIGFYFLIATFGLLCPILSDYSTHFSPFVLLISCTCLSVLLGLSVFDTILARIGVPKSTSQDEELPSVQFFLSDLILVAIGAAIAIQGGMILFYD